MINKKINGQIKEFVKFRHCFMSVKQDEITGKLKKAMFNLCRWNIVSENNFNEPEFQDNSRNCWAIKTGLVSNITVFDFDSLDVYNTVLTLYPDLKTHYHVKTRKGFHVYFLYDNRFKTSIDVTTLEKKGMDIRNDNGFVFSPPTIYPPLNMSCPYGRFAYEEMGGSLLPIPDQFIKACSLNDRGYKTTDLDTFEKNKNKPLRVKASNDYPRHNKYEKEIPKCYLTRDVLYKTSGSYTLKIITKKSNDPIIIYKKNIDAISNSRCGEKGSIEICSLLLLNDQLSTIKKYYQFNILSFHLTNNYKTKIVLIGAVTQKPNIIDINFDNRKSSIETNAIISINGQENKSFSESCSGNTIKETLNSARVQFLKNIK